MTDSAEERAHVTLQLSSSEPISGAVCGESGAISFTGWLELIPLLESARGASGLSPAHKAQAREDR